jgi:hypothetical protein
VSAGTPEDGLNPIPPREGEEGQGSGDAERLLGELRLAEAQERAAEKRHDAERMAETEAAYAWRRRRAAAARRSYRRFVRELARRDR